MWTAQRKSLSRPVRSFLGYHCGPHTHAVHFPRRAPSLGALLRLCAPCVAQVPLRARRVPRLVQDRLPAVGRHAARDAAADLPEAAGRAAGRGAGAGAGVARGGAEEDARQAKGDAREGSKRELIHRAQTTVATPTDTATHSARLARTCCMKVETSRDHARDLTSGVGTVLLGDVRVDSGGAAVYRDPHAFA